MLFAGIMIAALLQLTLIFFHGAFIASYYGIRWGIGRRSEKPGYTGENDLERRITRSLQNNIENYVVLFLLILAARTISNEDIMGIPALIFSLSRVVFVSVYLFNIPYLRTVFWLIGQCALVLGAFNTLQYFIYL